MSFALLAIALAAGQPAAAPAPPAKPDKICRQSQRQLGSRIRSGTTCKTAEQWEAEDARAAPASLIITEGNRTAARPSSRNNRPRINSFKNSWSSVF